MLNVMAATHNALLAPYLLTHQGAAFQPPTSWFVLLEGARGGDQLLHAWV